MMKQRWKQGIVVAGVLALLVLAAPVLAEGRFFVRVEIPEVVTGEPVEMELSLAEVRELALAGNRDIELAELGLDKARLADARQRRASDAITSYTRYELALQKYVGRKSTQVGLEVAEATAERTENGVLFGAESYYYALINAQENLKNSQAALERAREQERITQRFYDAGMVSRGDVMGARAFVASREADRIAKEAAREGARMDLAEFLALPLSTRITATDRFEFEPYPIDLDAHIRESMISDPALLGARGAYEIAQMQAEIARGYYTPNTFIYRETQYDSLAAELDFEKALVAAEKKVREAYGNIAAAEAAYRLFASHIEYAEESYRVERLRFEAGMATRLEVEEAGASLTEARDAATAMLLQYNMARASLEYRVYW